MKSTRLIALAAAIFALASGGLAVAQQTPAPTATGGPLEVAPGGPQNARGASPGGANTTNSNVAPSPSPSPSSGPSSSPTPK